VISQIAFLQIFKHVAKTTTSIGALTVVIQVIGAASVIIFAPFYKWTWPSGGDWWMWLLLGISFILFAVNDRFDATTRKNLDITVDTMLHQVYRILFFPMLILFIPWGGFNWASLIGGVVIVVMNMLLVAPKGGFRFDRYVWLKLLSVVFFTVALTMQLRAVGGFNIAFFSFLSLIVPAIFLMSIRQATPKTIYRETARKGCGLILLCGIMQGLAVWSWFGALTYGDSVRVHAITAVYVLINVAVAWIFLRERKRLLLKVACAVVIVGCLVLIALKPF
jgi:drug/metabolite transporter (DMT)-like permease